MLKRITFAAAAAAALPFLFQMASYAAESSANPSANPAREIRAALEGWTEDFNGKKTDKVCGLFAADLIAHYGDHPEKSYDSVCAQLKLSLTDPEKTYRYSLDIREIIVSGDLAVVRLVWMLNVYDAEGKLLETTKDRGMDVFRLESDGKWRISRYIAYPMGGD